MSSDKNYLILGEYGDHGIKFVQYGAVQSGIPVQVSAGPGMVFSALKLIIA